MLGRHNHDVGATQPRCWGDTTPMLGRRNFGWGDITWGDKAMGRHNLHSFIAWPIHWNFIEEKYGIEYKLSGFANLIR